jgi:chemotaxis family two-component system response regulator Rcp1
VLDQIKEGKKPRPDIIILDINVPKKSGKEVLDHIKSEPRLKAIPVIMLTSSDNENEIIDSYRRGANTYFTKPFDFYGFSELTKKIWDYWLFTAKLPVVN